MSRFDSRALRGMAPYVPGEQPRDRSYIKLNTNECPYPPSPAVEQALRDFDPADLRLYADPEALELRRAMGRAEGLEAEWVFAAGGSDEVLALAFRAFFDSGDRAYFPDITYGFYKVYADYYGLDAVEIPLDEDFRVRPEDYRGLDGHMVLANPNAPTGICLPREAVEDILRSNPDRLVIVDEAYIHFAGTESCVGLVERYENLLVVQTFSKSRALAGMHIGFAFGRPDLTAALERVKFSFNPYIMDRVSIALGIAAAEDGEHLRRTAERIRATRERTAQALEQRGFRVLPSQANFLFASPPGGDGGGLYRALKEKGILVRHFDKPRLRPFVRITIGSGQEMNTLLSAIEDLRDSVPEPLPGGDPLDPTAII